MMLDGGKFGGTRILTPATVGVMTTNQLAPEQEAPFVPGFWEKSGWGLGLSFVRRRDGLDPFPGSFGWMGGFSTVWWSDPKAEMVGVMLIQREMNSPDAGDIVTDFQTLAYRALED